MTPAERNELIDRATRCTQMDTWSLEFQQEWNAIEDHILGKLSLAEVQDLQTICFATRAAGANAILCMIP
jgi:hypothetical protein